MVRPHVSDRAVSAEGRALMKTLREKLKASAASKKTASHYLAVNPKDHSYVLKEKKRRRSAATYRKLRIRAAVKVVSKNYGKLFAKKSLRNLMHYFNRVYQGHEKATVYPRDIDMAQVRPTFAEVVVRNAGGVGHDIGFHPDQPLVMQNEAWSCMHDWIANYAEKVAAAIALDLQKAEKETLKPKHVFNFVKGERPGDTFLQRYILDSCMSKKELVQLAVDRVGGSVHKKKKKAKVAQENDGPAGPAGPAAVVNDDSD